MSRSGPRPQQSQPAKRPANAHSSSSVAPGTASVPAPSSHPSLAVGANVAGGRARQAAAPAAPASRQAGSSAASATAASAGGSTATTSGAAVGSGQRSTAASAAVSASKIAPRASPALSQSSSVGSPVGTTNSSNAQSAGPSMAKIAIIQVLVLLSSMKEGFDQTKADNLRKLLDTNGPDVFFKYFRQLVSINGHRIFGNVAGSKKFPSLPILADEMSKLETSVEQALKIAESLDTFEGEPFIDFDLSRFLDHFAASPPAALSLALAIRFKCKKEDLKAKAESIISSSLTSFPQYIAKSTSEDGADIVFLLIESLAVYDHPNWPSEWRPKIEAAIISKYQAIGGIIPHGYRSALAAAELLWSGEMSRVLRQRGARACATIEGARQFVALLDPAILTTDEIVTTILYALFGCDGEQFNLGNFLQALRSVESAGPVDWQTVLSGFDRDGLSITKAQFLRIYNALLPIAVEDDSLDIQLLWGGAWKHPSTQLSFVVAFLSTATEELDVTTIPQLKTSFSTDSFTHCTEDVQAYAAQAATHPLVSLEATSALFTIVFNSQESYNQAQGLGIPETVINANTDIFLVSAAGTAKPWTALQDQALCQLFWPFLRRGLPNFDFVMAGLWKQDNQWLVDRIVDAYSQNSMFMPFILDHAEVHGWVDSFLGLHNKLSLDLATLAHARGHLDIKAWFDEVQAAMPDMFPKVLASFTIARANSVIQAQRERKVAPAVDFSIKTTYEIVTFLETLLSDEELSELLRTCISAYPRIVNYGEGFDEIIDANAKKNAQILDVIDAKMQEHYKRMYSGESEVREIIENLQRYKNSTEPADQDLFACMIHGLFDEYNCFGEYPNEALATTAVLFGGIINYNLLSRVGLISALSMVYDSVKDSGRHESMYKFGVQAMLQFIRRLSEWPYFCEKVMRLPDLKGTEIWTRCESIVRDFHTSSGQPDGIGADVEVGAGDEGSVAAESAVSPFTCLFVDPPAENCGFETPDDGVAEKVLFVLNNVSEQNLGEKLGILKEVLVYKYYQWFAAYLVEERAKPQPNFQQLYLHVLDNLDDRALWDEVVRETYVSVIQMLNSDVALNSTKDRTYLKNLGVWLGSLTIARDRPIKFRNISFKDLLTEGYSSNRLVVVIPFTCKVLAQAPRSTVFGPPNPWLMEIVRILVELYHRADLSLKLKFEIEVLCKLLDLDWNTIEPSTHIQATKIADELFPLDPFVNPDLSLAGLTRARSRTGRISPMMISAAIPDLIGQLVYPPTGNRLVAEPRLRQIFQAAVQQALAEIISPVVERSVTIAAIAAAQLVIKDYATEPSEELLREAAMSTVKPLSGSLALVTCKEPLRISITNHIRNMARDLPDPAVPDGLISMFVTDNLDTICTLVEQAAEAQSMAEIEQQIESAVQARRMHLASRPDEPFMAPNVSRWALFLPEPYKHAVNGLNREQADVYQDFGRTISRILSQGPAVARESGRQSVDLLDQFSPLSTMMTNPAEPVGPAGPATQARTGLFPSPAEPAIPAATMAETTTIQRVSDLLTKLFAALKTASHDHIQDLGKTEPVRVLYTQLLQLLEMSGVHSDFIACSIAHRIPAMLYSEPVTRLEIELFIQLLIDLRKLSEDAGRLVASWLVSLDDDTILQSEVSFFLLKVGFLPIERFDVILSVAVRQKKPAGLTMLAHILDETVLLDEPPMPRTSLALSFDALSERFQGEPDNEEIKAMMAKLAVPPLDVAALDDKQRLGLPEALLEEWVNLIRATLPDRFSVAFVHQLHQSRILEDQNQAISFLRSSIEFVFTSFIEEASIGNIEMAYGYVDGLVKLIVALVVYQPDEQEETADKLQLLDGILCLLVMILARQHNTRVGDWNQRVWFRLLSTLFTELQTSSTDIPNFQHESALIVGKTLQFLTPSRFPGFAFGWINLLIHRHLMPVMLSPEPVKSAEREQLYLTLMTDLFTYVSKLNKRSDMPVSNVQFSRGALRMVLIIQHDFPDFVLNNHFELLNAISSQCRQLRNLVLSAIPEALAKDLPTPTSGDPAVWEQSNLVEQPAVSSQVAAILVAARIKDPLDRALRPRPSGKGNAGRQLSQDLDTIVEVVNRVVDNQPDVEPVPVTVDLKLIHAIVIATGASAAEAKTVTTDMAELSFIQHLSSTLRPEARYHLAGFMVDQLRYPNSHTRFFAFVVHHFFAQLPEVDEETVFMLQQLTRVFIERLSLYGPHPWGLLYTIHGILNNSHSAFFDLPFVKDNSEVSTLFRNFSEAIPSGLAAITA